MSTIPLKNRSGHIVGAALVDADDLPLVSAYSWHVSNGYAHAVARIDGRKTTVYMHRLVAGLPCGDRRQVDHINRDRLDNQRSNLRVVTHRENQQNRAGLNRTSTFRGVSWRTDGKCWVATAKTNGRQHYLGRFKDELDAARAAARFRAEHMTHTVEDAALLAVVA